MVRIITKQISWLFRCGVFIVVFLGSSMAYTPPLEAERTSPVEDSPAKRERVSSRATWEKILYLPGELVYAPLKYSLKGVAMTIGYVNETKILERINDILTSDDGRRGIEPTGNLKEWGASFYQKGLFGTPSDRNILTITSAVGLHQRQKHQCTLEDIAFGRGLVFADVLVGYRMLPTESFFGIGPDSDFSAQTTFAEERTGAQLSLGINVLPTMKITASLGYDHTHIADGRDPDYTSTKEKYPELPGIEEGIDMVYGRLALSRNRKNRPGNPNRGYEATLSGKAYRQMGDDLFGLTKYGADLIGYMPLFYDRVLVLRIAAEVTDSLDNREIPFYYLSELGRKESIRGFERGRFRDKDILLVTAEYRYPIWRTSREYGLDFLLFADAGQVSSDLFEKTAVREFQMGFGCGFRFWSQEELVAKFELSKSVDQWRFYFMLH